VSTSAVNTWRAIKIRMENLTEVPNEFLPLIQVPHMIPNKTKVLNLKTRKTQVPMGYLSLIFLIEKRKAINIYEKKKKFPKNVLFCHALTFLLFQVTHTILWI